MNRTLQVFLLWTLLGIPNTAVAHDRYGTTPDRIRAYDACAVKCLTLADRRLHGSLHGMGLRFEAVLLNLEREAVCLRICAQEQFSCDRP